MPSVQRKQHILALFIVLLVYILQAHSTFEYGRYAKAPYMFAGDEPKYLRMVQSLAEDGDLDVSEFWGAAEDIAAIREEALAKGRWRSGHLYIFGKNRGIYSLHLPGTALLIYPGYAFDRLRHSPDVMKAPRNLPFLPSRLPFTRLSLVLISAASLILLFRLLCRLFPSLLLTTVLLLLLIFNSPFCRIGLQVYPDGPALLFFLLALNTVWHPFRNRWLNDILLVLGLAFLPWLHQRFVLLSLGIYIVFVLRLWRKDGQAPLQRTLATGVALLALSLPYFYYFYSITGSPSPLSLARAYGRPFVQLAILPLGFFGQLFATKEGLLWNFPWTLFALTGLFWGCKVDRKHSFELLAISIPYYLACSAAFPWTGASSPPGRFLVPLLPTLLVLAGFSFFDLLRKSSRKKWLAYSLFFAILLLNRLLELVRLDFGYARVRPNDLRLMLLSGIFLLLLYGALFCGDRKKRI